MNPKGSHGSCFAATVRILVCAAPVWMYSSSTPAANPERGQALYETQCESCHSDWAHSRKHRKTKSLADLRKRTAAWSTHSGLDWSAEEIDDVVAYLDKRFYHFK